MANGAAEWCWTFDMLKEITSVHYNEIALKGKLRGEFEGLLKRNIAKLTGRTPRSLSGRIVLDVVDAQMKEQLRLMPGVSWIGDGVILERNGDALNGILSEIFSSEKVKGVDLDVRRIDKTFGKTSLEVKTDILKRFGLSIDKNGTKLRVEIMKDAFIVNYNIERAIGGMPVSSAGRVLSLFSGGIDSSVVPFELMKRGCEVDLLHVYAVPTAAVVLKSKITENQRIISRVHPARLYLVPFHIFGLKASDINPRHELAVFKRFLLKLAERVAVEYGYKGIATGDSLSQVASQTLDNLNAISYGMDLPVFRPLITYNKDEIIEKARFYGTYGESIKKYKDCCSLVSKNPSTKVSREKIEAAERTLAMDKLISDSLSQMSVVDSA